MIKFLKHYKRIQIFGQKEYKQFALIVLPDGLGDACVTLVRCKENKVRNEMLHWGRFDESDLKRISELGPGEQIKFDWRSLVIRLS